MSSVTVRYGERAAAPATPVFEGYVFEGWFKEGDDAAFDFENTPITRNITLYADWSAETTEEPTV